MSNRAPVIDRCERRASYRPAKNSRAEHRAAAFRRGYFAGLFALADFMTIVACFELVGVAYHAVYLHVGGMAADFIEDGIIFGVLFFLANILRSNYAIQRYLFIETVQEAFFCWNITSVSVLSLEFFLKETGEFSRVSTTLSYLCGFLCLLATRGLIRIGTRYWAQTGRLRLIRVVLVGSSDELKSFSATHQPRTVGIEVVASAVLRGQESLSDDLALAVALSRVLQPDSVFILSAWTDKNLMSSAVDAFVNVPAAIHLGPHPLLARFPTAGIHRIAGMTSLKVVSHPQSFLKSIMKRALDLVVAGVVFVIVAPVLALIAMAIKLESRGPILAPERLVGFNQLSFDALVFRTTHVAPPVTDRQSIGHVRPTRLGRLLAKTRLALLPQILNVVKGDMSLVGPRPKPLGHNQRYGKLVEAYGRRNNVKPGLTGWAQIHALRHETWSDHALQVQVEHDLYYVDRHTITLDLSILARRCLLPAAPDRRRSIRNLEALDARNASRTSLFETAFGQGAPDRRADILGIDIDDLSFEDALRVGRTCLSDGMSHTLFFVNAHTLNLVSSSEVYRRVIEQGHLVFGDGSGVRIAAAMGGIQLRANLNGTDFIPALLAATKGEKKSCYLLGGEQEVVEKAAEEIKRRFPDWTVAGYHHGYLTRDTSAAVIHDINQAQPDLLLVGMGNPLQEYWISENRERLPINLIVGVGALFSYISGDYRRAPLVMRRLGVEWLWVLVMQPHKWRRYVFGNPVFLRRAFLHALRSKLQNGAAEGPSAQRELVIER